METITTLELAKITGLYKYTLRNYLGNYRFNKYRLTNRDGLYSLYEISYDFLNTLYNFFLLRVKHKPADKLQKHFKDFNFKVMNYEEFLQC